MEGARKAKTKGGKGSQEQCWTCNETGNAMAKCLMKPAHGGNHPKEGGTSKNGGAKGKWCGKGTMSMLWEGDKTDFPLCIGEKPDQRILDYLELVLSSESMRHSACKRAAKSLHYEVF